MQSAEIYAYAHARPTGTNSYCGGWRRIIGHKSTVSSCRSQPRIGKAMSEQARAELSLVHVVNSGKRGRLASPNVEEHLHLDEVRRASGSVEAVTRLHGVPPSALIALGSPKDAILEFVDHPEADVLIIGRSSPTGSAGRLTDLTYAIVRDSPFSVLSV